MKLLDLAKKLPDTPGVYLFSGASGEILYVGRATNLRRRVAYYFRPDLDRRIAEMVSRAKNLKHRPAETVWEAIIMEANLIKKYWPKYNVKDRDDRSFIYLVIPRRDYAYPLIVRGRELKKFLATDAEVFGPYQNATLLKNALRLIRRIFPYGTCLSGRQACQPGQGRPCFDYQVGLCPGACVGAISRTDYRKNLKNIALLFRGEKKRLLKKLEKDNPALAGALKNIQDVALITGDELVTPGGNRIEGYDISHFAGQETVGALAVLVNGRPAKDQYRLFNIKRAPANDDLRALAEVVERRFKHTEWPRPDLILIDGGRPQIEYVGRILRRIGVNLPLVGISKLAGDRLVFPTNTKKSIRELIAAQRPALLKVRDEAHRFSNSARKRQLRGRPAYRQTGLN